VVGKQRETLEIRIGRREVVVEGEKGIRVE
jgi:hypothetical protein